MYDSLIYSNCASLPISQLVFCMRTLTSLRRKHWPSARPVRPLSVFAEI